MALLVFLLGFSAVRAQTPPPAVVDAAAQAAERLQREEQDRQREQQRRDRAATGSSATTENAELPLPKVSVPAMARREIKQLEIEGAPHLRPAFRAQLERDYSGRSVDLKDVEHLLMEITRHYVSRGYVTTRVYIPDQDLGSGVLRVRVVEGTVEAIKQSGISRNVFPTDAGELLNLRDLEQGIDNLNRLPSRQATLDLLPGKEAGGTVVGVRDPHTRRWRVSASADNTGSEGTGREQASLTLATDDLLRVGDAISVSHRRAVPYHAGRQASESTTASIAVPWGYQSFSLGGSVSSYALEFAAPSGLALPFTGDSRSLNLRTDRVLYRGQTARLSAYGTLSWRSSKNYLMGSLIGVSSRDATVLDLGVSFSRPLVGGFFSIYECLSHGLPIFGAASDPSGLPDYAPHAEFWAWKTNVSWSRAFTLRGLAFNFTTAFTGQWASEVLYGSDQLTVGGLYAVRGFDQTNLSGDNGYTWRNDLALTVPIVRTKEGVARATLRPYVGLDHGHAWTNVPRSTGIEVPTGSLVGATAGTGLVVGRYNADVAYSRSVARAVSMPRESGRVTFRVSASF